MKSIFGRLLPVLLVNSCYAWQTEYNYQGCRCVPYYQCQANTYNYRTGASIYGVGTNAETQNGPPLRICNDLHSVCCPTNKIMRKTDVTSPNDNDQPNPDLVSFSFAGSQDNFRRLLGQSPSSSSGSLPGLSPGSSPAALTRSSPLTKPSSDATSPVVPTTMPPIPMALWPGSYYWAAVPPGNGNVYIGTLDQQIFIINTIKDVEVVATTTPKSNITVTTTAEPMIDPPPPNSTNSACPEHSKCVPLDQCGKNNIIKIDGFDIVPSGSHNFRDESETSEQGVKLCGVLRVCCKIPPMKPMNRTRTPEEQRKCGQRNLQPQMLFGAAPYAEFPWMVAIRLQVDPAFPVPRHCGGALIHPRVVLSSAFCLRDAKNDTSKLRVHAGDWDIHATFKSWPYQERGVQEVIFFNNSASFANRNDYALLILDGPVDFSYENVGSVCLPESYDNFDFAECIVTRWGDEREDDGLLKKTEILMSPLATCREAIGPVGDNQLHENFLCGDGQVENGHCRSVGGSPLVCPMRNNPNQYVQAGVTSFSIGCGRGGKYPSVFSDVTVARKWIELAALFRGFYINEYQVK